MIRYKSFFRIFTFLFITATLTSCDSKTIFNETVKFNMRWDTSKRITFTTHVSPGTYQEILVFRYGEGYPFTSLKIHLTTTSDNSIKYTDKDFTVKIIDNKGNYTGDGLGEIWDIEQPLDTIKITSPQKIKFTISQTTHKPFLPMVMEAGIKLRKVE